MLVEPNIYHDIVNSQQLLTGMSIIELTATINQGTTYYCSCCVSIKPLQREGDSEEWVNHLLLQRSRYYHYQPATSDIEKPYCVLQCLWLPGSDVFSSEFFDIQVVIFWRDLN